jgi:segregation and condensation protein A
MNYRVELDIFRGPLDLLLYLVRKHEVDILEIPIALIAEQFAAYLEILSVLNVNEVGDFLEVATTLVEIKSRMVLPRGGEEDETVEDPRRDLVQQLLEYKKFRDAASMLEERGRSWQQRYPRLSSDLPPRERNLADEPIVELELWDLVSAFSRVIRDNAATQPASILYDETPLHVHMQRIHERLLAEGRVAFTTLFKPGMHKSTLIGLFLGVLELVRHHGVLFEQPDLFGEIWLVPTPATDAAREFQPITEYDGPAKTDE